MDNKTIGKLIRFYRHASHLTLEQLSEMADISPAFLGHIERGNRTLSVDTLIRLCAALGVTANDVIPEFAGNATASFLSQMTPQELESILLLLRQAQELLAEKK